MLLPSRSKGLIEVVEIAIQGYNVHGRALEKDWFGNHRVDHFALSCKGPRLHRTDVNAKAKLSAPIKKNKLDQLFRAIATGFSIVHHRCYNKGVARPTSHEIGKLLPYSFLTLPGHLSSFTGNRPILAVEQEHFLAFRLGYPVHLQVFEEMDSRFPGGSQIKIAIPIQVRH